MHKDLLANNYQSSIVFWALGIYRENGLVQCFSDGVAKSWGGGALEVYQVFPNEKLSLPERQLGHH